MIQIQSAALHPRKGLVETAYTESDAVDYEVQRFSQPCGRLIHAFELNRLLWGMKRAPASAKVLEVGCGTGRLLVELLRRGYDVTGLDASPSMLREMRRKLELERLICSLHLAEAADTGLASNSFDFVYAIRLLNQTADAHYALATVGEMMRLARAGGYVLAEFVNDYRPRWGQARRPHRPNPTRLRPWQVAEMGRRAGGEVVAHRGCFLLSMQAYHRSPLRLLPIVYGADRALSGLFSRLCGRTYILFRKRG